MKLLIATIIALILGFNTKLAVSAEIDNSEIDMEPNHLSQKF